MQNIDSCPICNNNKFNNFLDCKDYTVSRETFSITECIECKFKFTNPRPFLDKIQEYYKSESYISHSNTSKGFINKIYKSIRKYTLLKKLQLILKYFKKGNLLDIGSGTGEFLSTFKNSEWKVMGIEPNLEAREFSKNKYHLEVYDESKIKEFNDNSFDVITMWHVFEHVPDINESLNDIKRILKPNGLIIIAMPNCDSFDAKKYKQYWAAYDLPRHFNHFTPSSFNNLLKKHNLKLENILPMIFDSFYISLLSEKYKHENSNSLLLLLRSFFNGLLSNINALKTGKTYSSQIYLIRK